MSNLKIILPFVALILFVFGLTNGLFAQSYSVEIAIANQPDNYILFGSVRGDDFTPIDSSYIYPDSRNVIFQFPQNAPAGMYRVVLGKTNYAKVMDEDPQQLSFIFNNESIVLKTDFIEPQQKLVVLQSKENTAWYDFLAKDAILQHEINTIEKELDYYGLADDKVNANKKANDYNTLQLERDLFVLQQADKYPEMLASSFIKNQRRPLLDGYLTPDERIVLYKAEFFRNLDFGDERLIRTTIYTDNIFEYLASYNRPDFSKEQRETEYMKAVDMVAGNIKQNEQVYLFLLGYMVNGFNMLKLDKVNAYIAKKYNF